MSDLLSPYDKERLDKKLADIEARKITRLRISGPCHPPGQPDDYNGIFLTKKEIKQLTKNIKGVPVWDEHDSTKKVGEVVGGHQDKKGQFIVHIDIFRNTMEGIDVIRRLREKTLAGLSLGIDHFIEKLPHTMRIVGRRIKEVTVTESPDLDTFLDYVEEDDEFRNKVGERFETIIENRKLKKDVYKAKEGLLSVISKHLNTDQQRPKLEGSVDNTKSSLSHTKETPSDRPNRSSSLSPKRKSETDDSDSITNQNSKKKAKRFNDTPKQPLKSSSTLTKMSSDSKKDKKKDKKEKRDKEDKEKDKETSDKEGEENEKETKEDKTAKMEKELAALKEANKKLEEEKNHTLKIQKELEKNPELLEEFIATKKKVTKDRLKYIKDNKKNLMEWMKQSYIEDGLEPDEAILKTIETADENGEAADEAWPIITMASAAHNRAENSAKKLEEMYQKQLKEMEAKTKKESDKFAALQKQMDKEEKAKKYMGDSGGIPSSKSGKKNSSKDKKRKDDSSDDERDKKKNKKSKKYASSSDDSSSEEESDRYKQKKPDLSGIKIKGMSAKPRGIDLGTGIQTSEVKEHRKILHVLKKNKSTFNGGMEKVQYPGIVGKQYGLPRSGVNDHGEITHDTIKSDRERRTLMEE